MTVVTVNAGSHSLHLVAVDADCAGTGPRLDRSEPPSSDAVATAVRDFVTAHPRPDAVGHRPVHGGDIVTAPAVVDDAVRRRVAVAIDLRADTVVRTAAMIASILQLWCPPNPHKYGRTLAPQLQDRRGWESGLG